MAGRKEDDTSMELEERDGPDIPELPGQEIELAVGGGDDDDDADDPKPSRRERRNQRADRLVEEANRRADAAERMANENARALQQLATRPVIAQVQQPQQPQPDPYDYEAHQLRQHQIGLVQRYNQAQREGNAALVQQIEQESYELKDRMDANTYIRNVRRYGVPQQPQQPGISQAELDRKVKERAVQDRFAEQYPDIHENRDASNVFIANYNRFLGIGRKDGWDTVKLAAEETRRDRRMPHPEGKPAPSAATRARLSGMSVGSSGASAGAPKVVRMGKMQQKLADAAFPHIKDDAKRYQHWANTAGKNMPE